MPRPTKWRCVGFVPEVTYFKPAGVPMYALEEVCLSVEEAEAIRLKDLEGMEQEQCAQNMQISRPTFHRVLGSARRKLAEALLNGKAIRIEGGNFEMAMRRFKCCSDGHEWDVPFENMVAGPPPMCPRCKSPDIQPTPGHGFRMRGRSRRRGKGDEHEDEDSR
ncbi:MAG: DUF134 domain-containing protein [Chloroflexota bacterium]|nr:DUF134 domain-containing protein [Chloroflexota bacterium]